MIFKNPCLKCLVQPCCNMIGCDNLDKFESFSYSVVPVICFIFSIISVTGSLIFIEFYFSSIKVLFISMILIWVISSIFLSYMFDIGVSIIDYDGVLPVLILSPYIFISLILIVLYESYSKVAPSIIL